LMSKEDKKQNERKKKKVTDKTREDEREKG
jgi:hypothetical protein